MRLTLSAMLLACMFGCADYGYHGGGILFFALAVLALALAAYFSIAHEKAMQKEGL